MEGLGAALAHSGFNFVVWDRQTKPTMDMMYELRPDIVFYYNNFPDIKLAQEQYPTTKFWNITENFIEGRENIAQYLGGQKRDIYKCEVGAFTYNWTTCSISSVISLKKKFKIW